MVTPVGTSTRSLSRVRKLSQYIRAEDAPLRVNQYHMTLSRTPGRLLLRIPGVPLVVVAHRCKRRLLRWRDLTGISTRAGDHHVDVNPRHMRPVGHGDQRRHRRSPIATLSTVAIVA